MDSRIGAHNQDISARHLLIKVYTVRYKILEGENLGEFRELQAIHQNFLLSLVRKIAEIGTTHSDAILRHALQLIATAKVRILPTSLSQLKFSIGASQTFWTVVTTNHCFHTKHMLHARTGTLHVIYVKSIIT